ncbi:MAG: right-handed parallel beta-helix repeat-containing protein [Thermoplasmata archaeon]|nr:MAG: right-handed parallel beta-helix repeat-containing protein [Thermoplasmata archaeon]
MRKIVYLIVASMLIFNVMQIVLPFNNGNVSAGTPDDGVDGLQYIEGDWIVNGTETYTDEIIVLNGSLIINSGGSLTLRHVTLAMNCTIADHQYNIIVDDGGSLTITDIDGNPATVNDFSNITDSPFDTDNGSLDHDFHYSIVVYDGASFSIHNSLVRESGSWSHPYYGLTIMTDYADIQNCTFENNRYSIYLDQAENVTIANNLFRYSDYGITAESYIKNCYIYGNEIHNSSWGIGLGGENFVVYGNNLHHNSYGIYSKPGIQRSRIYNNDVHHNYDYGIYIGKMSFTTCEDNLIYNNEVYDNDRGLQLEGDNFTIYDNTIYNNYYEGIRAWRIYNSSIYNNEVHNNTDHGIEVGDSRDSQVFDNTLVYNGGLEFYSHNLNIDFCDNITIFGNTMQKLDTNSYYSVFIDRSNDITFHNNTVTHNDGSILSAAIRCDLNDDKTNNFFYDNNISFNSGVGLMFFGNNSPDFVNYIEVKNNDFYQNDDYGLYLATIRAYSITDNVISSTIGSGVWINDVENGDFIDNTIYAEPFDFFVTDTVGDYFDTNFVVTNCTCDPEDTYLNTPGSPTIVFQNYLHLDVTDVQGAAPNVTIRIKDAYGSTAYMGRTDENGQLRYIVLVNQTRYKPPASPDQIKYYDPYNITATSDGDTAWGEIEPIMDVSQTVNVHFTTDLRPETPTNLVAVSKDIDVHLTWTPCHSPDLRNYLIYRNGTVVDWVLFHDTIGDADPLANEWTDLMAASDWTLYKYKVLAMDLGLQLSDFSNVAKCGDWAINDTRSYSDFSIELNGSFIVLSNGNVTLSKVHMVFNCSNMGEFGIKVKPGGELYILDMDDDPQTIDDQSNITSFRYDVGFHFVVEGARFEMRNSKVLSCGSEKGLEYPKWAIEKWAPDVITEGDPKTRGLYISSVATNVLIENNNFTNNFVSILPYGAQNCIIRNNTFFENKFGIYLYEAYDNDIYQNTFNLTFAYSIYLFDSISNHINSNNVFIDPIMGSRPTVAAGIVIYGSNCNDNKIFNNEVSWGDYGIAIYDGGVDNNISGNNLYDQTYQDDGGIYIYGSSGNILLDNYFYNSYIGYLIYQSDSTSIQGGTITDSFFGSYITNSGNITLSNIVIDNALMAGFVGFYCYKLRIEKASIYNCGFGGLAFAGGSILTASDITIEDCNFGIYTVWGSENVIFQDVTAEIGIEQGFIGEGCNNVLFENCTFASSLLDFNLTLTSIILINTTYYQTKIVMDNSSSISLNWYIHVKVLDWIDNPVSNAEVKVRKVFGTIMFSGYTDSQGYAKWILLHERTQYIFSNETSNPHFIFANYGNHSGSLDLMLNQSGVITVYLENTAPTASNVIISPTYPTTVSNLNLSYMYTDSENDPEGTTMILWYIDGIHYSSFNNWMIIDSVYTQKGQTWFCEVIPHDGTVYGVPMISIPVTIQNTPPVASNVLIDETNPRSSDNLHVSYTYFDIDDDPETWSLRKWMVNNGSGWVYSGVDSMELSSIYTKKGDKWRCLVSPGDGDDYGEPKLSPTVNITNTAPEVSEVIVIPESPVSNETLQVNYIYFDLDDDPESGSEIRWYKDGLEQIDLYGSASVAPEKTRQGEKWYYIITPSDGEDLGIQVQSESIIIGNTPPSVSNVIINPQNPDTTDELTVEYDYYDEDDDDESIDTIIKWYRKRVGDLEFTYTGHQGKILSSSFTTKGEEWKCVVTPHDSLDYGSNVNSSLEVTILNSPPIASDVYISPSEPTTQYDLVANYEYSDLDSDSEDGTTIMWYRDGVQMTTLANALTVPSDETQKDQVWYFIVQPKDGFDFGDPIQSPEITIQNSPPTAVDLSISPSPPLGDNDLTAYYTFFDEDGDTEQDPEIKWYKSGLLQDIDGLVVESSATQKGDLWSYTLIVFDGEDYSELISSYHVVIENSEPQVNTISPGQGQITLNETESWEFYVDVEDPDGDFLLFKWKLGKQTVSDDEAYLFETDYESAGTYTLNLSVQDLGERSVTLYFEWTIVVNNVNLLPQIEVKEPISKSPKMKEDTSLKFMIDESDPDAEDTLEITWYFDDVVVQTGGSSYTYFADYSAAGKHKVTAVVSDGTDETEYGWNLSVADVGEELILGLNWDQWSIILEILVIAGTGLLAFIGYSKIRKKKGALKKYMAEIDEISEGKGEDPVEYENKLNELDARINDEFKQGNIEDLHFLMLEEIMVSKRGEIRRAAVAHKFEELPEGVTRELDEMLADGRISREEYEGFVMTISQTSSLTATQRKELSRMIGDWEVEDKGNIHNERPAPEIKPEKYEIDEEIGDKSDESREKENIDDE